MKITETNIAELNVVLNECERSISAFITLAEDVRQHLRKAMTAIDVARSELTEVKDRSGGHDADEKLSPLGSADTLITTPDLVKLLGVARQTIWRLRKADDFPRPIRVSPTDRIIRYRKSDIDDWIRKR